MAFNDYYKIMEVSEYASLDEIKNAYKKQSLRWHPDKNLNIDTTPQMQLINEAFLILKDTEAKKRYDVEYKRFKYFSEKVKNTHSTTENKQEQQKEETKAGKATPKYEYTNYKIQDETLEKWINNARKQAVELAKQTLIDFGNTTILGVSAFASRFVTQLIIFSVLGLTISLLFKMCAG